VLLTIAFPRVKLIWSSSPYQTAEIFDELKRSQKEPDPLEAIKLGLGPGEEIAGVYNQTPQVFLNSCGGRDNTNGVDRKSCDQYPGLIQRISRSSCQRWRI